MNISEDNGEFNEISYRLVGFLPAPWKYDYENDDDIEEGVREKEYRITIWAEDVKDRISVQIEVERRLDSYFSDYGERSFKIPMMTLPEQAIELVIKKLCNISTDTNNFKPLIKKAIKNSI